MIPYFQFDTLMLGIIPIRVWGLCVALGILAATWVAARRARTLGLDTARMWDLSGFSMVGAFLFARLFMVLYEPAFYLAQPWKLLNVWEGGFSMMGGLIGAALFGVWYLRRETLDVRAYADCAVYGLPLGIGIGRIGCFLIHDHPGTLTHFWLGVRYPDGIRHDHGLYLSLNGFLLFAIFFLLARRNAKTGTFIVTYLLWDGVTRFFLDFLRATDVAGADVRYVGLTPAQYVCLCLVAAGGWLWYDGRRLDSKK